jgi:hypothetical protein
LTGLYSLLRLALSPSLIFKFLFGILLLFHLTNLVVGLSPIIC